MDQPLFRHLTENGIFVLAMVGTDSQARRAFFCGANGLIAQGSEAGGHLAGDTEALTFLPRVLEIAHGRPVFLAGGIATAADTTAALAAGANGVVAGTRFLLTREARAHPEYQRRILAADTTFRTTLFGLGRPAPHRVVANAATRRWCRENGNARLAPRFLNVGSRLLAKLPDRAAASVAGMQKSWLPLFSPVAPTVDMPESWVDRTALYAGESVLRLTSVISAREAVNDLSAR